MSEHHAEAFIENGRYGWQCLTCADEETDLSTFAEAEVGRDQHESEI